MSSADKPTSENKKFVNPFKTGELKNPGVDIRISRERTEQKLSRLKPKQTTKKSK